MIFKVGYEPLYNYGDEIREQLEAQRRGLFRRRASCTTFRAPSPPAVRAIVRPGVRILTVHALGGIAMMQAAVEASPRALRRTGHRTAQALRGDAADEPRNRGPRRAGVGGRSRGERDPACGAGARRALRGRGLQPERSARPQGVLRRGLRGAVRRNPAAKARRTTTRSERRRRALAVEAGADYLVVGRPITEAADPRSRGAPDPRGDGRCRRRTLTRSRRNSPRAERCWTVTFDCRRDATAIASSRSSGSSKIPKLVEPLAAELAAAARAYAPTVVVSAAVGGIVLGYEVARQLGTLADVR